MSFKETLYLTALLNELIGTFVWSLFPIIKQVDKLQCQLLWCCWLFSNYTNCFTLIMVAPAAFSIQMTFSSGTSRARNFQGSLKAHEKYSLDGGSGPKTSSLLMLPSCVLEIAAKKKKHQSFAQDVCKAFLFAAAGHAGD